MTQVSAKDMRARLIMVAIGAVVFLVIALRNGGGWWFLLPMVGAINFITVALIYARRQRAGRP